MQLRPDQLPASLDKAIKPVYLVSGDEPLQVMECADAIRAACRAEDYLEREVIHADKDFDWQRLHDAAGNLSLFASRRILDLRLPSAKPGREGGQALKEYAADLPPDTVLLITAGKLDAAQKKTAWLKALEQAGVLVQCWPVPLPELPGWIRARCHARGLEPDDEVVGYIGQRIEGNMLAAAQEVEKLRLLHGTGKLAMSDVLNAIGDSARFNVFDLVDSALQGDRQRVVRIVSVLKAEGVEPIVINWALSKDIRTLAQVAGNRSVNDFAFRQMGVWANRLPLFRACLKRHKPAAIRKMLQHCARIDSVIKGVEPGESWDEILELAYRLAGSSVSR